MASGVFGCLGVLTLIVLAESSVKMMLFGGAISCSFPARFKVGVLTPMFSALYWIDLGLEVCHQELVFCTLGCASVYVLGFMDVPGEFLVIFSPACVYLWMAWWFFAGCERRSASPQQSGMSTLNWCSSLLSYNLCVQVKYYGRWMSMLWFHSWFSLLSSALSTLFKSDSPGSLRRS